MKRIYMILLCASAIFGSVKAQQSPEWKSGYEFTDVKVLADTAVENQFRSGTCWAFSTVSMLECEILRAGGEAVELSEMWVVRNIYFEKAVKYVRMHGTINFAAGGAAHDVIHAIQTYGIMPAEVYRGLNYGTEKHHHNELDAVLTAYVEAIVSNPNKVLTTAWKSGLNAILDTYFGVAPTSFEYKGKTYTPQTFAASLPLNMEDYVSITSFTHHPFYKPFILEIPDNWYWASSYNVPLDEMMSVVDNALANNYAIAWGADVSERGFSRKKCIAIVPEENIESLSGTEAERWGKLTAKERANEMYSFEQPVPEKKITQQMRQEAFDNYETTDDHGMVILGTAIDQTGAPFFKVKNSWDVLQPYGGYWYVSRPYVEYKTMNIIVNRNAVPKGVRKKLGL